MNATMLRSARGRPLGHVLVWAGLIIAGAVSWGHWDGAQPVAHPDAITVPPGSTITEEVTKKIAANKAAKDLVWQREVEANQALIQKNELKHPPVYDSMAPHPLRAPLRDASKPWADGEVVQMWPPAAGSKP